MDSILHQYIIIISFSVFMMACMRMIKRRETAGVGCNIYKKNNNNTSKIGVLFIFVAVIFVLYTSFRQIERLPENAYISGGGLDALVYKDIFMNLTGSLAESLKNIEQEPLWLLWNYIIRCFTDKFEVFLVSFFLVEFFLQYRICKELASRRYFSFCYLTIIVNLLLTSLCIMRATLCIFIIGNAIIELKNKRSIRAIIFGIIATGIHYSSLIFFPSIFIYFIYKDIKNKSGLGYLVLCIAMAMVGIVCGGGIGFILQGTRYSATNDGYAWGLLFFRICVLFAIVNKFNKLNINDRRVVIALAFYATNFMVFGLQIYMTMAYRMYLFNSIAELILIPELLSIYKRSRKHNVLDLMIYIALISLYLVQFIKFYFEGVNTYGLLTYRSELFRR